VDIAIWRRASRTTRWRPLHRLLQGSGRCYWAKRWASPSSIAATCCLSIAPWPYKCHTMPRTAISFLIRYRPRRNTAGFGTLGYRAVGAWAMYSRVVILPPMRARRAASVCRRETPSAGNPGKSRLHAGHRQTFWKGNCVAVGLAGGFLEPLGHPRLVLIELSAEMVGGMLPATRETMHVSQNAFNETTQYRWHRIIDFLKLHYILSRREDSRFWIDNRDPASIPDSLKDQIELWRYRAPAIRISRATPKCFCRSYQYVFLAWASEWLRRIGANGHATAVEQAFARMRA